MASVLRAAARCRRMPPHRRLQVPKPRGRPRPWLRPRLVLGRLTVVLAMGQAQASKTILSVAVGGRRRDCRRSKSLMGSSRRPCRRCHATSPHPRCEHHSMARCGTLPRLASLGARRQTGTEATQIARSTPIRWERRRTQTGRLGRGVRASPRSHLGVGVGRRVPRVWRRLRRPGCHGRGPRDRQASTRSRTSCAFGSSTLSATRSRPSASSKFWAPWRH
mmetsp:Transcript_89208/g.257216  ORF Transcript_89208/g.257216 Transcript_89208/m.257216 type:complete len:220 (-) Transcript_89208:112-771(-)